jgi:hypothetical protein
MRKAVKLRSLTTEVPHTGYEEEAAIRRLAASRKEAHRLVQRAKVCEACLRHCGFTGRSETPCNTGRGPSGIQRTAIRDKLSQAL